MAPSVHYPCLMDAYARIVALQLPAVGAAPAPKVTTCRLPVDEPEVLTLPGVMVSFGGVELLLDGDFEDREVGYPVVVTLVMAANRGSTVPPGDEPILAWRRQIRDAFWDLPASLDLGEAVDCYKVTVEPGPILVPELWQNANLWVSQLTLRYYVTESCERA